MATLGPLPFLAFCVAADAEGVGYATNPRDNQPAS